MKKLSHITESVWSDIQDRNSGEVVRKEDQFNPEYIDFGDNTTVYWAKENLVIDGKSEFYFDDVQNYNNNGWRLPTNKEVQELNWSKADIYWAYGYVNIEFKGIEDGILRIKRGVSSTGFHMWTKDRHERFKNDTYAYGYDNSYHFMVEPWGHINKCYVFLVKDKKKVNESLWSDIQDRNSGEVVRKEDGNLSDLKPVDMGGTVLWADRDLEMNGEFYFEYDKANQLIKNTEWRLPTTEEVSELQSPSIQVEKNTDEVYIIYKKSDPDTKLVFEKKGYKYALEEKIYRETTYHAWTSSKYEHNTASWAFRIAGTYYSASYPMDKLNRICVRLVQDK